VEAAGVEPNISVENTQHTDSGNASFAGNAMISNNYSTMDEIMTNRA
jgi:hypothetical protein